MSWPTEKLSVRPPAAAMSTNFTESLVNAGYHAAQAYTSLDRDNSFLALFYGFLGSGTEISRGTKQNHVTNRVDRALTLFPKAQGNKICDHKHAVVLLSDSSSTQPGACSGARSKCGAMRDVTRHGTEQCTRRQPTLGSTATGWLVVLQKQAIVHQNDSQEPATCDR